MLIRKMRIEKGWSQETLAEISDLSVRTVQRIERGHDTSLETMSALAAVFEVDVATLATQTSKYKEMETDMYKQVELPEEERNALIYVRDIKGFYTHLVIYLIAVACLAAANYFFTPERIWFIWATIGWGTGVFAHGLIVHEVFTVFSPRWERRQVQKHTGKQ